MESVDVLVIGAGVTGCAVAEHLVRLSPGLSVLLVDRHHVGAGSTSRSTAAFRHQWSVPVHVAFSQYAAREYRELTEKGYPIGFHRNGYLFLFTDPKALELAAVRVERQRGLGVRGVHVLRGDALRRLPVARRLRLERLAGATWGPEDGFLDPLAVAQAYLEEARRAGVSYRPETGVAALHTDRRSLVAVELGDGTRVATEHVVNATGVWTPEVARLAGLDLPVEAVKRYLYHSRPVPGVDVSAWPLVIGDRGAHFRPSEGNTLMLAWEHRPTLHPGTALTENLWRQQDVIDPGFDAGPDGYGTRILGELAPLVPLLGERVGISRATCGWYAVTPDHKAILDEDPQLSGLYHATGFSGHGIMHGAATGRVVAERILGHTPTLADRGTLAEHFGLGPLLDGKLREPVEDMVL